MTMLYYLSMAPGLRLSLTFLRRQRHRAPLLRVVRRLPPRPAAVRAVRRTLLLGSLGGYEPMQVAETTPPVDEAVTHICRTF